MLTLGTRRRSAAQIASEVDGLGASLSAHAGWEATALHLQGLKEDLDRLLELLREMVAEPSFPEEEFAQLQQRRVAALVQQKDESQIVAGERFEEILFRGTPYDHPVYGTLKTVPLISRDEVQDFYRRRSLPEGSFWVLAGDVDPEDCFRRLEANFSILTPGPARTSPFHPAPPQGIRTFLIDRPDLTQSQIRLGHLGIPPVHPDSLRLRGDELHSRRGRILLPADAADPGGVGVDVWNPQFLRPAPPSGAFCGGDFHAHGNHFPAAWRKACRF